MPDIMINHLKAVRKSVIDKADNALFSEEDDAIINGFKVIVKGIAAIFGKHCEVVLHSVKDLDHSVVAIENAEVTGRKVGSPMTDLALSILERIDSLDSDVVGTYNSHTKKGDRLKSVTVVIRNLQKRPIGLLCININVSAPVDDFMNALLASSEVDLEGLKEEHYPLTSRELLERSFQEVTAYVNTIKKLNPTDRVKQIVKELYKRGIFNVKNGIDFIADELGISRYTVYNYIRNLKMKKSI